MSAAKMCQKEMSLNKALQYCGLSKSVWYRTRTGRKERYDSQMVRLVRSIAKKRPSYGTRRMAHQVSRQTAKPVSRKKIQRIYRKIGWIEPKKTKKEIIRGSQKRFRPTGPNQLWQTDITYVSCGRDGMCYCFNVLDAYTRQWLSYVFEPDAHTENAVESIVAAVADLAPDCSNLRIRTDNGTQYTSRQFRDTLKMLGILHELIAYRTPEQNGHIESFHGTMKREYIWPYEFASFQEAAEVIGEAFEDYNIHRIHSSLGYLTPAEFAERHQRGDK